MNDLATTSEAWEPASNVVNSNLDLAHVTHPLPPDHAYVEITVAGDKIMRVGDVAQVDMGVHDYVCDTAYAMEIDGEQTIRRIRAIFFPEGLCVWWGEHQEPFDPVRMKILGRVRSFLSLRCYED